VENCDYNDTSFVAISRQIKSGERKNPTTIGNLFRANNVASLGKAMLPHTKDSLRAATTAFVVLLGRPPLMQGTISLSDRGAQKGALISRN